MTLLSFETLLDGARVMASLVVALCFWRLGRTAKDRLYYVFAVAFVLFASSSVLIGLGIADGDQSVYAFLPRLLGFLLIIYAIVDKNRRGRPDERS